MLKTNPHIKKFLELESASGILLVIFALIALLFSNSFLNESYQSLFSSIVQIRLGPLNIEKPLILWINDGLMAIFFLLVGLELKRELIEGELSNFKKVLLPAIGAFGGMVVPAIIYWLFNADDPIAMKGWAIPVATDIAFALGVLMLLGSRVSISIKVFLISIAIFDDIGAIAIIAVFYTENISFISLLVVAVCLLILWAFNRKNIVSFFPYIFIGIIMWIATLKSGVHATLAGVALAAFIPMRSKEKPSFSPLKKMENDLHTTVAYIILPIFAFANSGINFAGVTLDSLYGGVTLGIAIGLIAGKQIGVFLFCLLAIKLNIAKLPNKMNLSHLYGVSLLCGIGFTMSLFIGSLSFSSYSNLLFDERIGIMLGSLISGIIGYLYLNYTLKRN